MKKKDIILIAAVLAISLISLAAIKMTQKDGKEVIVTVDGKEVKMNVTVGQKVIYSKYAGTSVELDDEEYIIVKQDDILAICE